MDCLKRMMPCLKKSPQRTRNIPNPESIKLVGVGSVRGRTSDLHIAAFNGNVDDLKKELFTCKVQTLKGKDDKKQRTPLHYAVTFWFEVVALEMTTLILEKAKALNLELVNERDLHEETPLHLAVRFRHPKVAELLLNSGAYLNLRTKYHKTGMDLIYEHMPQIMNSLLDASVTFKDEKKQSENGIPKLDKSRVKLSFKCIVGDDISWTLPDTNSLYNCLKNPKKDYKELLSHSLVQMFLFVKWKKISVVFKTSIALHIIWALICAWYLFYMYIYSCPFPGISIDEGITCDIGETWLRPSKIAVMVSSLLMAIKEISEILTAPKKLDYITMENIGQWLLIVLVFVTVPVFEVFGSSYPVITLYTWHYIVAAFGMLFPWFLIMGQVGKVWLGVYLEIFKRVCKSFVLFTVAFIFIPVAFALSFTILMPKYLAFRSAPSAMVKVLVMMTGEFEFEEMFSDEKNGGKMEFLITAHLVFVLFVAIVTITLFNLLIGLNVSDIQGLRQDAEISELVSSLERIHLMEDFLISCNKFLKKITCGHLNLKQWIALEQTISQVHIVNVKEIRQMTTMDYAKRLCLEDEIKRLAFKNIHNKKIALNKTYIV